MTTPERANLLARYCQTPDTEVFLGYFASVDLMRWIKQELGHAMILDEFCDITDGVQSLAVAQSPILHILSGNTPHAGLQSLLRGLLVGAKNLVKLPSTGLRVVEQWIAGLPAPLAELVEITTDLDTAFEKATVVIAIGSDETTNAIQRKIKPHQRFIPHGHKLSIALIDKPSEEAAHLAVRDACAFNQQGCLSTHTIYAKNNPKEFAAIMAKAMSDYEKENPRGEISLSESGAISNHRKTLQYLAANDPQNYSILESEGNTAWTVIYRNTSELTPSPLNRVISVQPWPDDYATLGAERQHISTLAAHPEIDRNTLTNLDIPRICPLGKSQQPALTWHHDGFAPLHSLIKWRDLEMS